MELIIVIVFVFCTALAAGSILLQSRLIKEHRLPFLTSLFYFIIFIFTFGFYGVWGQFIIVAIAGNQLTPEVISSISVISLLLGLPFLVFGWLMLMKFATESSGRRFNTVGTAAFLVVNFSVIITLGYLAGDKAYKEVLPMIKYYYAGATGLFSLIAAILILKGSFCLPERKDRISLSLVIVSGAVMQAMVLIIIPQGIIMALVFVFLLFLSAAVIPFFITYYADIRVTEVPDALPCSPGIESFFQKHEISPREAEIIREICNGLSNKEIAEKLFISLQTVKDHTSRIYTKTNVRSRMQLMTLVRNLPA